MSRGRGDHDPAAPRLQLLIPLADNAPKFIVDAVERASWIYTHPERFPEITGAAYAPGIRIRRRRTSLLEAAALTVAALARRCDRRTFRVGDQRADGLCNGVPISELCKATGLTPSRQARAIRVLKDARYQQSSMQPVVELEAPKPGRVRRGVRQIQRYAGLPAVRTLSPLLFQRLGFAGTKIKKARQRGYQEWIARRAPVASPVAIISMQRDRRQRADRQAPAVAAAPPAAAGGHWLAAQVRAENPALTPDQVAAEVARLIRPPPH